MLRVRGLVAQEVAVCPRFAQACVALAAALAYRERDGAVGVALVDGGHQCAEPLVVVPAVLAALEHKGAKAQLVARVSAAQHILGAQAVTLAGAVAGTQATVEAVVLADVGEFDEAAHEDLGAVVGLACRNGAPGQLGCGVLVLVGHQVLKAIGVKAPGLAQLVNELVCPVVHGLA